MSLVNRLSLLHSRFDRRIILTGLILVLGFSHAIAGTWTALTTQPPTGVNSCMVLSDGTVLTYDGSGNCNKLTPDIHGGYINGTWTRLAAMNNGRLFFASQLLTNGQVFVAGGEDGSGHDHSELYDPLNNIWSRVPDPIPGVGFSDAISAMLPNGNVLVAPVSKFGGCLIYNAAANTWQTAATALNQNEVCWVKLPSDNILTIDTGAQTSEHYVPSANQWIVDGTVPVVVYGFGAELGAGFLLPNGNVFYIGGSTNTAIYTPGSTPTSAGTWVAGPVMVFGTNQLGAVDAPAAMMANGKILCDLGPVGGFNGPCSFFEYDYVSNTFTAVNAPGGGTTFNSVPFANSMLCLPDGTVLFVGGQNSQSLYVYSPAGTPLAAGQPTISSITENPDGSFQLTGTGLNGISAGAAYGDDEQMESDYPLARMTNTLSGNVYYARTYNWNNTSLQTGSKVITTQFSLPQNLPAGTYSLSAVANGNPSVPQTFNYQPPAVPTGLTAPGGSNGFVNLSWNASVNATAYNVKRATNSTGFFSTIATVTGLGYTNFGLTNGLTYYYKVAAIGSGGPSSDSAAVAATPAGPSFIPGATSVSLAAYYNRIGIVSDGRTFTSGFDGGSSSYSANLLGPSLFWDNLVFPFGPANSADAVYCANQTISLPAGRFNSLQILAAGVNGSQTTQSLVITYTDNSTATFIQSFSDWANPQSYPGEFSVVRMPYRNLSNGGTQILNMSVFGYIFVLDQTKTVKSITLPSNANLVLLSMMLANDPVGASLASFYNRAGIYTDGSVFTNPPTGGMDGGGWAYSANLLGNSQTWNNAVFGFGPFNATNVVSCAGQTIPLPPGNYAQLKMLGTGVDGNQAAQTFLVTYTDASTATFVQGLSDWFTPQGYAGENKVVSMSYRNNQSGSSSEGSTMYLYGYTFALNQSKIVQSIRLPVDGNAIICAMSLVPNWPPTFGLNPFTLASANAGQLYTGTISTNASDLNGGPFSFSKVSGPAWLSVASTGALSGTPLSGDVGNNVFVVQVTDPGGLSSTATMSVQVIAAPPIILSAVSQGDSMALSWSGGIAPYQVYMSADLATWQTFGSPIPSNSVVVPFTNNAAFFQVSGQ